MKTFPARFLVASLAAIATVPALAQTAITLGQRPITRAEVAAFAKRQFAQMDTNHDHHVSPAEFEHYRMQQGDRSQTGLGHVGQRWFEKTDADGDGEVTLAEAVARPLRMFDMADINRDGIASLQEQSFAQMLKGN